MTIVRNITINKNLNSNTTLIRVATVASLTVLRQMMMILMMMRRMVTVVMMMVMGWS